MIIVLGTERQKVEPLGGIEPPTYALPRRRYLAVRPAHYHLATVASDHEFAER